MAYTFQRVVSDRKDVTKRRRVVSVEFADGADVIVETKEFTLDYSPEADKQIRREFSAFLDGLNEVAAPISDIAYTPDPDPTPDATETAFMEWEGDLRRLVAARVAGSLGIDIATPAQITALTNKVQTGLTANRDDERYISALAAYSTNL
jgi:hypothetical protein